jgi:hypothetical protein
MIRTCKTFARWIGFRTCRLPRPYPSEPYRHQPAIPPAVPTVRRADAFSPGLGDLRSHISDLRFPVPVDIGGSVLAVRPAIIPDAPVATKFKPPLHHPTSNLKPPTRNPLTAAAAWFSSPSSERAGLRIIPACFCPHPHRMCGTNPAGASMDESPRLGEDHSADHRGSLIYGSFRYVSLPLPPHADDPLCDSCYVGSRRRGLQPSRGSARGRIRQGSKSQESPEISRGMLPTSLYGPAGRSRREFHRAASPCVRPLVAGNLVSRVTTGGTEAPRRALAAERRSTIDDR